MNPKNNVTVLESCRVAPPATSVPELSYPLCFSDMCFVHSPPLQQLLFYETPVSKNNFIDTIIPDLKKSLCIALKHFPSLAGKMILHSDYSSEPQIRFTDGDSVSLVFAESTFQDYEFLVSNQPRICNVFYPLVPPVPKSTKEGREIMVPLLALQVTLFEGSGICIGIANHHVVGDGSSMLAFVKGWATISKLGEDYENLKDVEFSPVYDRGLLKDRTKKLDDMVWNRLKNEKANYKDLVDFEYYLPKEDKVRGTFVVGVEDVNRLKRDLLDKRGSSSIKHLSTFTVLVGYVWSCLVKADNKVKEQEENEMDFFLAVADFRSRVDPPIPKNYFGNCLAHFYTGVRSRELSQRDDGFARAAELIGEAIHRRLENKGGLFQGIENMFEELKDFSPRILTIAGSQMQNYYNIDFRWGKPIKYEVISIDYSGTAVSLSRCRDGSCGTEVGVVLERNRMNAFVEYFRKGLSESEYKADNQPIPNLLTI